MVGVKLWVARHCDTPELDLIVKCAGELKAPVLQHTYIKATGNLPGENCKRLLRPILKQALTALRDRGRPGLCLA